jgi:HD-like signal output (HDOD) protein
VIHAFRLGPLSSGGYAYVALAEGGEPRVHEAPSDRAGLTALKSAAGGEPIACEPALADAGKGLGLESAPLPPGVLEVRALLAYELASGIPRAASKPDAIAEFLEGAAAFWRAKSWEVVGPEERLRVAFLEGHAEVDGELSVMGGDGMRLPGVALCDARGALEQLARLDGPARAEAAVELANLTIDLEREPEWAAEALDEGYRLARVPMATRKRGGAPAPMVTQDLLVSAALLQAVAAWTELDDEGAVGEGAAQAAGMRVVAKVRASDQLPPPPAEGLTPVSAAPPSPAGEAASEPAPEPIARAEAPPAAAPPGAAARPAAEEPAAAPPAPGEEPAGLAPAPSEAPPDGSSAGASTAETAPPAEAGAAASSTAGERAPPAAPAQDPVPAPAPPPPVPAQEAPPAVAMPAPSPAATRQAPATAAAPAAEGEPEIDTASIRPGGWLLRAFRALRGGAEKPPSAPAPAPAPARAPRAAPAPARTRPVAPPPAARPPPAAEPEVDGAAPFAPFARALLVALPAEPPPPSAADEAGAVELGGQVIEAARTSLGALVSFPAVALEIIERVHDPKADARGVAGYIARDPALAADVLSVANSAAFRGASEIESVHEAVARLGLGEVGRVASAVAARKVLDPVGRGGVHTATDQFLRAVAVASAAAGAALRQRGARSDHVWLGGLLHDVGRVLARQVLARLAAAPGAHLTPVALGELVVERVHAEIGEVALRQWALPGYLLEICAHHHDAVVPPEAVDLHLVRLTSALDRLTEPAVAARAAREIVQSAAALRMDAVAVRALATDLKTAAERARSLVR